MLHSKSYCALQTQNDAIQLCSFHSVSKGVFGECGQRGGYVEMVGIPEDVNDCFYKLAASKLCSNAPGQAMVSLMCRGPNKGDASFESHDREKKALFEGLKERALMVSQGLDGIPGFACQPATGAMYCFVSWMCHIFLLYSEYRLISSHFVSFSQVYICHLGRCGHLKKWVCLLIHCMRLNYYKPKVFV